MKFRHPAYLPILALAVCLVAFPPFIATLELHHQLGDADQDGHQHSSADLCSWVQAHASSSVTACAVVLVSQPAIPEPQAAYQDSFVHHFLLTEIPARAPPSLL